MPERHEPDTGEINYPYLFELMDRLGYAGWVGCEYFPAGRAEDGLGWAFRYGIAPRRTTLATGGERCDDEGPGHESAARNHRFWIARALRALAMTPAPRPGYRARSVLVATHTGLPGLLRLPLACPRTGAI